MQKGGKYTVDQFAGDLKQLGGMIERFYSNKMPGGGKPTTNATNALKGVQLPIAGYRGSGLAWMVDIMSGVLTGSNHGGKVKDPFDDFTGPQNVGHLFLVLKPNLFLLQNRLF